MNNPASNANETLTAAARSLRNVRIMPIGSKSQALRRAHYWGKLSKAVIAVGAVMIGAGIVGAIIDGIGFDGRKPNAYLDSLPIGLKGGQTVEGGAIVGN